MGQEALAAALLITRSMVPRYESGMHEMGKEIVERAAKCFGVPSSFIMFGEAPLPSARAQSSRIVGTVGAGAQIDAVEDQAGETINVPEDFADLAAFRVAGDSCLPVFEPGDVLLASPIQGLNEAEFVNRFCIVETDDGKGWVKKVRPGVTLPNGRRTYNLESPNADTLSNRVIVSARPVLMRILGG